MKQAICDWCGSDEVYFDAFVDVNDEVVNVLDSAFCAGECDGEIKHHYTIKEETK